MKSPDWSGSSGDIWARRWRDTDRALAEVGAVLDAAILAAAPAGAFRALDVGCGPGTTTLALASSRPDAAAPAGAFRALDVGCGPGTTTLALASSRPDADIIGCDLSRSLVTIAEERAGRRAGLRFVAEDAEQVAREHGPFDLVFSRHGVMFFDDPARAFASLRTAANRGGRLVFSCFREWDANPWAAELASAAAGRQVPAPGREPSGFAFAEPVYVAELLTGAGWAAAEPRSLDFAYDAGSLEQALSFLAELGPAARLLEELGDADRSAALERMRHVIERHDRGGQIIFPGAAWIWTASAA